MGGFHNQPEFIAYYILSCISIIGNTLVIYSLLKIKKIKTCFTFLLYFLHFTALIEQIFTLPFLWKYDPTLCRVIESFQCYFGLMNIFTIAMLVEAHRSTITEDSINIKEKIMKYGLYILLILPMPVFIGYTHNDYDSSESAFCTVPSKKNNIGFIFMYYTTIWITLLFCISRIALTLYQIARIDMQLGQRFFSSIGLYIIIAVVSWIPRSFVRFSNLTAEDDDGGDDNVDANKLFLASFYPIVICGLLFVVIFLRERKGIKLLERHQSNDDSANDGFDFSWDEILNEPIRSSATGNESMFFKNSIASFPSFGSARK